MIYDIIPVNTYEGNNSSTEFDFDFYIDDESQLVVYKFDKNNAKTELQNGIDYTISGVKNENGGSITFPVDGSNYSILSSGEHILLELTLPISQEVEYNNSSDLNPKELEYSFDYLTRLIQIIKNKLSLCVKVEQCVDQSPDDLINEIRQAVSSTAIAKTNSENFCNSAKNYASIAQDSANDAVQKVYGTLNTSQISNCILEAPHMVDLTLSDGTLTLHAGSKVIVPYGKSAPTMAIGDSLNGGTIVDISWDEENELLFYIVQYNEDLGLGELSTSSQQKFFYATSDATILFRADGEVFSGATSGTTQNQIWYDTENNIVKQTNNSGTTWTSYYSLPFARGTFVEGVLTSIDQVFQYIGYIGSAIWAMKGIKGLIPNGRKEDGSLNNIEHITPYVITTQQNASLKSFCTFQISDTNHIGVTNWFYDQKNNNITNGTTIDNHRFTAGKYETDSSSNISYFEVNTSFQAVDYNDTEFISHQSMPGGNVTNLTLGASGTVYNAPADGYFMINKGASAVGQQITMVTQERTNSTSLLADRREALTAGSRIYMWIKVAKGQSVTIQYTLGGSTQFFRFIYAQGATQ